MALLDTVMGETLLLAASSMDDEELTATIRAYELGYFMGQGKGYTVKQTSAEFDLSPSGAYRLLERVCGSRRVPTTVVNGIYRIVGV